jgi:O-antigen biosynthesis protein
MSGAYANDKSLPWTGERYIPEVQGNIALEHLHRYVVACELASGKKVLDIACGEGYGSAMLAEVAHYVVGVDISREAIAHATSKYNESNLEFKIGSCDEIPLPASSIDLVVSFETIEHHDQHEQMLSEIKRILRPGGVLIISSPDKYEYSVAPNYSNPYHVRELYRHEFEELMAKYFRHFAIYGQRVIYGSGILAENASGAACVYSWDGAQYRRADGMPRPQYLIAIASDAELPSDPNGIFEQPVNESEIVRAWAGIVIERDQQVARLNQALAERDAQIANLNQSLAERDVQIASLNQVLVERDAQIANLNQSLAERDVQIASLNQVLVERDVQIANLSQALSERDAQITSLSWAVTDRDCALRAMRESTSWRITAPLRIAGNVARRAPVGAVRRQVGAVLRYAYHALRSSLSYQHWLQNRRAFFPPVTVTVPQPYLVGPVNLDSLLEFAASELPLVSIVVAVRTSPKALYSTLKSLHDNPSSHEYEVIVIHGGDQPLADLLAKNIVGVRAVECTGNLGTTWNAGAAYARGQYLAFLDDRIQVQPKWLDELVASFGDGVGLVGSRLVAADGTLIEAGGAVWRDGALGRPGQGENSAAPQHTYLRDTDFCSAAFAVTKDSWEAIQGASDFDTYAPCDIALKVRGYGRRVLCQPLATAVWEAPRGETAEERARFTARWEELLKAQPTRGQSQRFKRVLFIDSFTPKPDCDSGSVDALHHMKIMRSLGYQVSFISAADLLYVERYTSDLQRIGVECLYPPYVPSVDEHLRRHGYEFDLVILSRVTTAARYIDPVRRCCQRANVVFNTVDLHHLRELRQADVEGSDELARQAERTRQLELGMMKKADCTIVISTAEEELLRKELPDAHLFNIPLVMEIHNRNPKSFAERKDIFFIGGYQHVPNVDAVRYFVEQIWPLLREKIPGLKFYIVGSHPPQEIIDLASHDVMVVGYVEDLSDFFNGCRLSIAPLRYGAGIKGKVGRSLAYGLPVVATSIATEGTGLVDREDIFIADGAEAFAAAVAELYNDEAVWNRLSRNGIEFYERNYSFEAGRRKFTELLRFLDQRRPQTALSKPLELATAASLAEYRMHHEAAASEYERRKEIETRLAGDERGFVTRGFCYVCKKEMDFHSDYLFALVNEEGKKIPNWRERIICPSCGLNNRTRAAIQVFEQVCKPQVSDAIYITEQTTPLFAWFHQHYGNVIGSEYLGDTVPYGKCDASGVRNESLTRLTFSGGQFDYILSFDVFEHIPDYERAFLESARCLKPHGVLLFSVPFNHSSHENTVRARIGPHGRVEHLLPAEYHGDPLNKAGCLCLYHFGWKLLERVCTFGFSTATAYLYWSEELGYLGGEQILFLARKGESA